MIDFIKTNVSPPIIGWIGPLVIIAVTYALIGRRLPDKYKVPAAVYVFSIVTGIVFDITQNVSNVDSAVIAGVYVPLPYYIFFGLLSVVRSRYYSSGRKPHPLVVRFEELATGSAGLLVYLFLGGVIGLIVGGIATFAGLTYAAYETVPDLLVDEAALQSTFTDQVVDATFNVGVYVFGALGAIYGAVSYLRGRNDGENGNNAD